MSYRSWLKDVKHINDLYGFDNLVGCSYDSKDYDKRDERADRKIAEGYKKPLPIPEKYHPFFGSKLHDSWVLGVEREGNEITVRIDSAEASNFAHAMKEALDLEVSDGPWPIHLMAHDVSYARWARIDREGYLKYRAPKFRDSSDRSRADSIVRDHFVAEGERLQWIVEFRAYNGQSPRLSMELFLAVDCRSVSAVDLREAALVKAFGEAVRPIWTEAVASIDSFYSLSGAKEFVKASLIRHKLTRADFIAQVGA